MSEVRTVDFWFDPVCPYTWISSRWMVEVTKVRPVAVRWRVMSLSVLNEHRDDNPEGEWGDYMGAPVRVCAAVEERFGRQALGELFTAMGTRFHLHGYWGTSRPWRMPGCRRRSPRSPSPPRTTRRSGPRTPGPSPWPVATSVPRWCSSPGLVANGWASSGRSSPQLPPGRAPGSCGTAF